MAGDFIPFAPESMMWRINRERVVYVPPTLRERLQLGSGSVAGTLWFILDRSLRFIIRMTPAPLRYTPQYLRAWKQR